MVGDSNLGGISSTLSAYESLLIRGFDVDSLLIFEEDYYKNWDYLSNWFAKRNARQGAKKTHVGVVRSPPPRLSNQEEDGLSLKDYYQELSISGPTLEVLDHLEDAHARRIEDLKSMPKRTLDQVWWPFVQHGAVAGEKEVTVIDSAHRDHFHAYQAKGDLPTRSQSLLQHLYDGSASWWTQSVGHANSNLTLAASYAAGRYGHVMFPLATHEPALQLAERLIHHGPGKGWASRAFFSDNGSTGMEVALKMALRAFGQRYQNVGEKRELGVIGLKGSYHGDTIGAMDACEGGPYSEAVEWYRGRGFWFDVPTVGFKDGRIFVSCSNQDLSLPQTSTASKPTWEVEFKSISEAYDVELRLNSELADIYRSHVQSTLERLVGQGRSFGALVIEPLVMGAGGMLFVDPLFHRILIDVVRESGALFARARGFGTPLPQPGSWSGLPVIVDEVFTGLYRVGVLSSTSILKVNPDISVLAKILTGGLLPLSVTLSSSSIFEAFKSKNKVDALLHGHSYTAHPIGCAVANESLNLIEELRTSGAWETARTGWKSDLAAAESGVRAWSFWDQSFIKELSTKPQVEEAMALGTVLAFRLRDPAGGTFLFPVNNYFH